MSERNSTPLLTSGSRWDEVGGHDDLTEDLDLGFDGAEDILRAWRRGMRPDPDLTVSEWADQHRWLSSRASAEPGRYRTARTPYMREIMDALSPRHPAQRISFMKAAQVGATEAGNNWIGFVIHHAPGPMLAVLPAVEMATPASNGTVSGATLTGGLNAHTFMSGIWTLPSMSIEVAMPEVPRFAMYSGCVLDALSWSMERSGLLGAKAMLVAQGEAIAGATAAGTPAAIALKGFGHFNGAIKRDGVALGNIVSADLTYANNLDRIETIRSDAKIDGADPTIAALTGKIEVRFADTTLLTQAINCTAAALEFCYVLASGEGLTLTAHAVYLPRPRIEIKGPKGVQASFDWQAALATSPARMCTVVLVNSIGSY